MQRDGVLLTVVLSIFQKAIQRKRCDQAAMLVRVKAIATSK